MQKLHNPWIGMGRDCLAWQRGQAIRTAFRPTTPGFPGLIDRFLADRQRLIKGPYVRSPTLPSLAALWG